MNEYHDRNLDDPHPAEDRPVAGWSEHGTDEHTEAPTGERTDEMPREGEPLVGEVVNEESAGEHGTGTDWGEHGRDGETGETGLAEGERLDGAEETGQKRVGEPFGTEEPMIVDESEATTPATGEAEPVAAAEPHEAAEPVAVAEPVATTEPADTDAVTEPEAEPVVEGARPTAADDLTVENLLEPDAAERFRDRWREVKGAFVDDPADAVRQASALSGEAVDELTAALGRLRQDLDGHWDEGKNDTEHLRVALRGYGSLIDRILTR